MLGHSMGTLRLYELLCEVQKHLGGLGQAPQKILQPPKSVLKPYVYSKLACGERTRLIILWIIHSDTAPFDFKTV